MNRTIIHVSEVNISPDTGMGRVEWYWKQAFEKAGYNFLHIGPGQTGPFRHPALFPRKAYHYYRKLNIKPEAFIVHEPASGPFVKEGYPCFLESHGVERRYWESILNNNIPGEPSPALKTRILFPLWRLRNCDKGLKKATRLLLINNEDSEYVQQRYKRSESDIFLFHNGVQSFNNIANAERDSLTVIFNGSWIARKGIHTLVKAAEILHSKKLDLRYLIIGTGSTEQLVLADWPDTLKDVVEIVPKFAAADEMFLLAKADIFVLPSFFEGQPLSLLQGMYAGKCCIATNCCGQKDIITHGENGLLFEPGDAAQLAAFIETCYHNKEMVKSLGENAAQHVKDRSWEQVADDLVQYVIHEIKSLSAAL